MRRAAMLPAAIALALVLAGCGSSSAEETTTTVPPTTTTTAATTTTTTTAPTTTSTSTTTTSTTTTTTTTTAPPTPEDLRSEFLAGLDAAGWITYTDPVIGWSIRYPTEWEVLDAAPGEHLFLTSGSAEAESVALFMVSTSLDAGPDSEGSLDYLEGNIGYAIADGLLRPPESDAWFWLDLDFDGVKGLHDIEGVKASLAKDPMTGSVIPAGQEAPSWWYGYYSPDLHPAYGYMLETIGTVPDFFQVVDDVVLSFEPPSE